MEDTTIDDGVETSISDDVESDLDLIGGAKKGSSASPYIEQDNL